MRVDNAKTGKNQGMDIGSPINVMMATNEAYVVPASVTIKSIRKTSVNPVCVYVLYSELKEESIRLLENLSTTKLQVKCVYINLPFFNSLPIRKHYTKEIYYRLFGYLVLPVNIDRIIWLDADIIVMGDLAEFYRYPMDTEYFVGCEDEGAFYNKEYFNARIGMDENSRYMSSGVMLLNLKQIRSEGTLVDDVINFISETKLNLLLPDQDIINALYWNNGKMIVTGAPYIYNQFATTIRFFDIKRKGIVCLHYVGNKPWKTRHCNNRLFWFLYGGMFAGRGINVFKNFLLYGIIGKVEYIYFKLLNHKCGRYLQNILWKIRGES